MLLPPPRLFILLLVALTGVLPIADSRGSETETLLTIEQLQSKRGEIDASEGEGEVTRSRLLDLLEQAIEAQKTAEQTTLQIEQLREQIEQAPTRLKSIQDELGQPPLPLSPPDPASNIHQLTAEIGLLETRLREEQAQLNHFKSEANQLFEITSSQLTAEHRKALQELEADLKQPSAAEEPLQLREIHRQALMARHHLRQQQLTLQQTRTDHQELLNNWMRSEVDLAERNLQPLMELLEKSRKLLNEKREQAAREARKAAEQERLDSVGLPTPIQAIAQQNVQISDEMERITQKNSQVVEQLQQSRQQLSQLKSEIAETRRRAALIGSSESVGRMLHKRKQELPSLEQYRRSAAEITTEIDRATNRIVDIDEMQRDLKDLEETLSELMALSATEIDALLAGDLEFRPLITTAVQGKARQLLLTQREHTLQLYTLYSHYISQLTSLYVEERQLVEESEQFIRYINERLIWIRNIPPPSLSDLPTTVAMIGWLFSPTSWATATDDLLNGYGTTPAATLLLMVGILLWLSRTLLLRELESLASRAHRLLDNSNRITLQALLHTLLLSMPLPTLLYTAHWALHSNPAATSFSIALGNALPAISILLLTTTFFRYSSREHGLGTVHFQWPAELRRPFLLHLNLFNLIVLPALFIAMIASESGQEPQLVGIGRPAFLVGMGAMLLLSYQLLKPSAVVQCHPRICNNPQAIQRIHWIWLPTLVLLPLLTIVTSISGHHHSAVLIADHLLTTALFFSVVFLLKEGTTRSLQMADRRLRYEEAVKRREELRQQREMEFDDSEQDDAATTAEFVEVQPEAINIQELSDQANRLLYTALFLLTAIGLWMIWSDLIPVLEPLESVTLPLNTTELIDGIEKIRPITLVDLIIGAFFVTITFILARNLPGLLEIILLQRLPLDLGARYAIRTLTQYTIVAFGIIAALNAVGAQWSSVQWLVAALGVGLGFGLQEIVANFVSGIILLFERPIRVGDTITAAGTTGVVVRIRIRATTIRTFDRQELVIPNKEFITGQLLNWTLSDQLNRLIIPVGIAYGNDAELASRLMVEAAREHPHVIDDPEPSTSFDEFGDNALILKLRCFLDSIDHRLSTTTALHHAINRKLNEAGLVMAFPQRDIHFDNEHPLEIKIRQ